MHDQINFYYRCTVLSDTCLYKDGKAQRLQCCFFDMLKLLVSGKLHSKLTIDFYGKVPGEIWHFNVITISLFTVKM